MLVIKQFKTETAHIVRDAFSERCAFSIHGHSYVYEVAIEGKVRKDGMVLDFKRLDPIKNFIDQFDHSTVLWSKEDEEVKTFFIQHFSRVLIMKKNPTAENMVRLISKYVTEWLKDFHPKCKLNYVKIWETTTGSAQGNESDKNDVFDFTSPIIYLIND